MRKKNVCYSSGALWYLPCSHMHTSVKTAIHHLKLIRFCNVANFLHICRWLLCLDFTIKLKDNNIQLFSTCTLFSSGFLPDLGVPQRHIGFFSTILCGDFSSVFICWYSGLVLFWSVFCSNSINLHRTCVLSHIQYVLKCFNILWSIKSVCWS